MTNKLKFSQLNEYAILIEWPAIIDEFMLKEILGFKHRIQNNYIKQRIEVINTYNSILIIYDVTIDNFNTVVIDLKKHFKEQGSDQRTEVSTWEIPVCYDDEFGVDLSEFSKQKKSSKAEIIKLHSEVVYTVFFMGFLPGFLYLGGLNSKLFLDRKTTPNLDVKKGSVAIGGHQTGIYPQDSPGGWHIIGNSPIELFNAQKNPPTIIRAGDKVKFISIDKKEHAHISKTVAMSKYQLKSITINA